MRIADKPMRRRECGIAFCNEATRLRAQGTVHPVIDDRATR
jgi:hypothetical protein